MHFAGYQRMTAGLVNSSVFQAEFSSAIGSRRSQPFRHWGEKKTIKNLGAEQDHCFGGREARLCARLVVVSLADFPARGEPRGDVGKMK